MPYVAALAFVESMLIDYWPTTSDPGWVDKVVERVRVFKNHIAMMRDAPE